MRNMDAGRRWRVAIAAALAFPAGLRGGENACTGILGLPGVSQAPVGDARGGNHPRAFVVGDWNEDGKLDLAAANQKTGDVSVLLGHGDGTFGKWVSYPAGGSLLSIAAGDFDGDGNADLAAPDQLGNAVSVLLGRGDGTFAPRASYPTGTVPSAVAAGDFDGDGRLDLATAGGDGVSVLLGRGDGSMGPPVHYPPAAAGIASVAVGDFNGDGKPDLAVAATNDLSKNLNVLVNRGDGTFSSPVPHPLGSRVKGLAAVDLDGNGKPDLVAFAEGGGEVLLGNGDGGFQPPATYGTGPLHSGAVGEFDGDGKWDLVVLSFSGAELLVGNGDGAFSAAPARYPPIKGRFVGVGDFNGDGRQDIATANADSNTVSVALNRGGGAFTVADSYPTAEGETESLQSAPSSVAIADFNGDGRPDFAVASQGSGSRVYLNRGGGAFAVGVKVLNEDAMSVAAGDVNGDGKADLVMDGPRVLLGNGDGGFAAPKAYPAPGWHVALGDFNGDGRLDVASGGGSSGVGISLGFGDGAFAPPIAQDTGGLVAHLAAGDVNGDGRLDLAVAGSDKHRALVFLGNGDGTLAAPPAAYPALINPQAIAIEDLNADGRPDMAVASQYGRVGVLLNAGDGAFAGVTGYAAGYGPWSLAVGDLNGDGRQDLAVAEYSGTIGFGNAVRVLLGDGAGGFSAPLTYGAGWGPWSVAMGDLNGDGRRDLTVLNRGDDTVSVLLNVCIGPGQTDVTPPDVTILAPQAGAEVSGMVDISVKVQE